jgi:hypothetical protein
LTCKGEGRAEIARLNDEFRLTGKGGEMFMTPGIAALPLADKLLILTEVRYFSDFAPDNDPHGERDCAGLTVRGHEVIWKIDYLPVEGMLGVGPDNARTIRRVLVIMLAEEY